MRPPNFLIPGLMFGYVSAKYSTNSGVFEANLPIGFASGASPPAIAGWLFEHAAAERLAVLRLAEASFKTSGRKHSN